MFNSCYSLNVTSVSTFRNACLKENRYREEFWYSFLMPFVSDKTSIFSAHFDFVRVLPIASYIRVNNQYFITPHAGI